MNLPNRLTILRILLIPVFMACLLIGGMSGGISSLIVFVIASLTDFADGYIARKYNCITNFGKFADPLADKLLVFSALTIFTGQGKLSAVALFIMLARELIVTGFRLVAVERGVVIAAGFSGKVKTVVQFIGIIILLSSEIFISYGLDFNADMLYSVSAWVMAAVTVYSGCEYIIKNYKVLSDN